MSHHPVSHRFGFRRGDAHPRSLIEKDSEIEIVCEKDRMIIKKVSPMGVIIPLPRDQ